MSARYCFYISIFLILNTALFIGCAKPPIDEMIRAEKALDEARLKEAEMYTPDIFRKAVDSFSRAKDLVATKKYDEARQIAIETAQIAEQAAIIADLNKEKERKKVEVLQGEAEDLRSSLRVTIDELRSLKQESFRKSAAKKYEQLQEMIMTWETAIIAIQDSSGEEGMIQANEELKKLLEEIETEKKNMQASLIKKKRT